MTKTSCFSVSMVLLIFFSFICNNQSEPVRRTRSNRVLKTYHFFSLEERHQWDSRKLSVGLALFKKGPSSLLLFSTISTSLVLVLEFREVWILTVEFCDHLLQLCLWEKRHSVFCSFTSHLLFPLSPPFFSLAVTGDFSTYTLCKCSKLFELGY